MVRALLVVALLGVGVGGGCARQAAMPEHARAAMLLGSSEARQVRVFDGRTGGTMGWDALVSAAAASDAVFVGENHGHPLGLAAADALWEDVLAKSPKATLAMEFFERDQQAGIDDYLSGVVDEAAFKKLTAHTTLGTYPPGHRAMVEAAKAHNRPVIAANSPRRYVRLARESGFVKLGSLNAEQKRLFRVPDSMPGPETKYRQEFDKIMSPMPAHGTAPTTPKDAMTDEQKSAKLDAAFRSQSVWDWTMGESVVRGIEAGGSPTLLVVGRFHVDFEGGTVRATKLLRPGVRTLTVSFVDLSADSLRDEDKDRADIVIYVGESVPDEEG
jgi:uncharacterized iron-regulated protein